MKDDEKVIALISSVTLSTQPQVLAGMTRDQVVLVDVAADSGTGLFEPAMISGAMTDETPYKRARIMDASGKEISLTTGSEQTELKALMHNSEKASRYGEVIATTTGTTAATTPGPQVAGMPSTSVHNAAVKLNKKYGMSVVSFEELVAMDYTMR